MSSCYIGNRFDDWYDRWLIENDRPASLARRHHWLKQKSSIPGKDHADQFTIPGTLAEKCALSNSQPAWDGVQQVVIQSL